MVGKNLGPYKILEEIGKGGIATVYRAFQPAMKRSVAIKVLHTSFMNDATTVARFHREARMVARLEQSHILPIYDFDGAHDPPYIVMRYLDGSSLKKILSERTLESQETLKIMRQIASALDFAHRRGVMHRDIKPSNIMIDHDGNVFVTDFGLARMIETSESSTGEITQSGIVIGTPTYMAPEYGDEQREIDHRADIYSLGIILFQMLTGELPYSAPTALGVIIQHFHAPVPSVVELKPDLPVEVDAVVEKVMAKSPDDRYQSAKKMVQDLAEALGETPRQQAMSVKGSG